MSTEFSKLGVPDDLIAHLAKRGITAPYPVQAASLPDAFAGHDVCAESPTGSGKTIAFGLPLIARVGQGLPKRPAALVLAPTRELAAQIAEELAALGSVRQRTVETFYGGVGFGKQLNALKRGVDIAVACPGRLLDLMERRAINMSNVEFVVIDEADRMADMGFMPVVTEILEQIGTKRQTLLFSATLRGDVEKLIRKYQNSPKRHVLAAGADDVSTRTHRFIRTAPGDRTSLTAHLISDHASAIVFCRTKRGVDRLTTQLTNAGIASVPIHGDRSQQQRDRALAAFHDRRAQVLVGTDVASRGLHIENVGCVIHFDPPEDHETFVHRSGRTGRGGKDGLVISLVSKDQESNYRKFRRILNIEGDFEVSNAPKTLPVADRPAHIPAPRGYEGPRDRNRSSRPGQDRSHSRPKGPSKNKRRSNFDGAPKAQRPQSPQQSGPRRKKHAAA